MTIHLQNLQCRQEFKLKHWQRCLIGNFLQKCAHRFMSRNKSQYSSIQLTQFVSKSTIYGLQQKQL